jgi:hypothetical protein
LPPRGVAECVKDGVELLRIKFNHAVEYASAKATVNLIVECH